MSDSPTLYLVTNSPGEVTTFVRPVVQELARRHPHWKLQICLVPCPYATGAEASVIEEWPEQPAVWTPWQTTRAWIAGSGKGGRGLVVFLGGDPWHALLLKSRFGLPAMAYFSERSSWERSQWLGGFDLVAVGYERDAEAESEGRRVRVPDLRVDAVLSKLTQDADPVDNRPTLALFPGSRWLHLKAVLGPFLRAAEMVREQSPNVRVVLAASPFVSRERLHDAASNPFRLGLDYAVSTLSGDTLVTETGLEVEIVWGDPYRVMAECDLAISLPGTNTAELAIAGKPTVVPLSTRVPVGGGGILGILDRLPGFKALKKRLKYRKYQKLSLVALPNQLAGEVVMPEFLVRDDLTDLASFVSTLLQDHKQRAEIGKRARDVLGPPGGAAKLADWAENLLSDSAGKA